MKHRPTRKQVLCEIKELRTVLNDKYCTREDAQQLYALMEQQSKITAQLMNKVAVLRKVDMEQTDELNDLIQQTKGFTLILGSLTRETREISQNMYKLQEPKGLFSRLKMAFGR